MCDIRLASAEMNCLRINVSLENAERYYSTGNYSEYKVCMPKIIEELDDSALPGLGKKETQKRTEVNGSEHTLSLILENNLIVAECLELKWESENAKETWDQLLLWFKSINERCTDTYLKIASPEFHLSLTVVHNYLFWSWINPRKDDNYNHVEENLLLAIRCMDLVWQSSDKLWFGEHFSSEMNALQLMKLSCTDNILFYSEGTHNIGLQILEIYFLTIQIIIESVDSNSKQSDDIRVLEACADVIQTIVNFKQSLETCTRTYFKEESYGSTGLGLNVSQFKFGLHRINSRVGDVDIDTIFNAFCFAGSICYLKLRQLKPSLALLRVPSTIWENNGKPSFILNYLKSCIYFKLNDVDKSLMFLRKVLDLPLNCNMMARSVLLHGLILGKKGHFVKAQNEFVKVQKIGSYLPLALYYSTLNYKSQLHDEEVSTQSGCDSDQRKTFRGVIGELHIKALNGLVYSLKEPSANSIKMNNYSGSLELKFLSLMHPQLEITASQAVYLLARELNARREYSCCADKLLYLLNIERDSRLDPIGLTLPTTIPPPNILMHETTALLIQGERWTDAEIVCNRSLSGCANVAEALISNMFLAQIKLHKEEKDDAITTLLTCVNSVDSWVAQHASEYIKNEPEAIDLGKRIRAKVWLQIALIFIDTHKQTPGIQMRHLRQALCESKVDKDALYHLLLLLKNDTESHELWKHHKSSFDMVDIRFTNIALDYLLRTKVTKEQVHKLAVWFLVSIPMFSDELEDMEVD